MIVGGYERNPAPWCLDGDIPPTFNNTLLDPDWDRFAPIAEAGQEVVPALVDADVVQLINGPEAFTPDGEFILGESEVAGFFVAAGFCAHGIAGAGGVGKVMAEWIVGREPPMDLWKMDVRRFGPQYRSRGYCLARTDEIYSTYYDIVYPNHERRAGRPLRRRRRTAATVELGAEFGEKSGWERVNWYRSNEDPAHEHFRPRGLGGRALVDGDRHRAPRDPIGGRAVRRVELRQDRGRPVPGAAAFLERLCANRVDRAVGSITYTSMLNSRGGIECDVTVTRLALERFLIVTGTAFGRHDRSWIEQHAPTDGSVDGARRHVVDGVPRAVGPGGARRPVGGVRRRPDVPVHAGPRTSPSATCRAGRCASRTSASSAGSCTRRSSTACALWDTLLDGRPAARAGAGRLPGDRLAAAREGLPGLGRRHHERDRPVLVGARVRGARRQGVPRRATRCPRRRADRRGWCASCSTTRGRSRSATSRCGRRRRRRRAGVERWPRLLARAVDRLRLAAGRARRRSAPADGRGVRRGRSVRW